MKQPQVEDRLHLVYYILLVLGVGTLLPWNVFLTEKEFFDIRLHVEPSNPAIANNFVSLFGLVFNISNLLAVLVIICVQQDLSLRTQILNPLLVILVVLASTAALALQLNVSGTTIAYYSLPALGLLGMCMAVLQGGLLNLASMFPPIYIQGYVVGAGLSGVGTAALSFFSQLGARAGAGGERDPSDVAWAGAIYFGSAAAVTALCAFCYTALNKLPYSRAKLLPYLAGRRAAAAAAAGASSELTEALLLPPGELPLSKNPNALPHYEGPLPYQRQPSLYQSSGPGAAATSSSRAAAAAAPAPTLPAEYDSEAGLRFTQMARDFYLRQIGAGRSHGYSHLPGGPETLTQAVRADAAAVAQVEEDRQRSTLSFVLYACSIVLVMAGSLSVWPGVTAFICSVDNPAVVSPCAATSSKGRLQGDLWVPAMFLFFALGDLTGRIVSSWGPWGRRPPAGFSLLLYALLRCGISGALCFCRVITPTPWGLPQLFMDDYYPIGFVVLLGLTQGHLLSTACMHAPAVVPRGKEGEFGPVTGLCITVGCLLGSVTSVFLVDFFTSHSVNGV